MTRLWSAAALVLWFLNMYDALATLKALREPGMYEANPAMAWLIAVHPAWFVAYKLGFVSLLILGLGYAATHVRAARWCLVAGLAVYAPLAIYHALVVAQ